MNKPVRVGQVGLGRLGMHYAQNLHFNVPNAILEAVCSIEPLELSAFKKMAPGVASFPTYESMLESVELDAVVIVSTTGQHVQQIRYALEKGLHVFCEKPLSQDPAECFDIVEFARSFNDQMVMIGFNRRYDSSYRAAKQEILKGTIGKPFLLRSQTVDLDTVAEFQLKFAQGSGGIFIDYNVHDIDLMRWFLDSEVSRLWSLGGTYKFPQFKQYGDADYATTMCEMQNGSMAVFSAGRTATHGHDTYTEITGTEGSLRIGRPAVKNILEIYDRQGIRKASLDSFWERFESSFLLMIRDFVDGIQEGRKPTLDLYNAAKATEVAEACTRSFRTKTMIQL